MILKKVCMLGAYGVGKTSLIARFVQGVFDERYLSTVGVKIDRKAVDLPGGEATTLVLWDLAERTSSSGCRPPTCAARPATSSSPTGRGGRP